MDAVGGRKEARRRRRRSRRQQVYRGERKREKERERKVQMARCGGRRGRGGVGGWKESVSVSVGEDIGS